LSGWLNGRKRRQLGDNIHPEERVARRVRKAESYGGKFSHCTYLNNMQREEAGDV
jgi:hypothetical protein